MRACLLLITILLASCSRDGEAGTPDPSLLIGTWQSAVYEEGSGWDLVTEYSFMAGNLVERSTFVNDHATGELLGHNQVASGTFATDGDQLLLEYTEIRQNNSTNPYMARDLLLLTGYTFSDQFTFQLNSSGNSLSLKSYCAPGADCPGSTVFQRH